MELIRQYEDCKDTMVTQPTTITINWRYADYLDPTDDTEQDMKICKSTQCLTTPIADGKKRTFLVLLRECRCRFK